MSAILIGVLCSVLMGSFSWASEGLFLAPPPPALQTAWNNVYMVVLSDTGGRTGSFVGTTFVVKKQKIQSKYYLGLATAGHVVYGGKESLSATFFSLDNGIAPIDALVVNAAVSPINDLGLFLVSVSKELYDSTEPLKFPEESECLARIGQKNYLIGFPAVSIRDQRDQKVKIEDPQTIRKRWSQGLFASVGEENPLDRVGTTADVIEGNSGSPVLDEQGRLRGVLVAIMLGNLDKVRYFGSDVPLKAHAQVENCDRTKVVLASLWKSLVENLKSR